MESEIINKRMPGIEDASVEARLAHVMEVMHLNVWYGENQALKDINVSFFSNKVHAIMGPSGCGKTTLIRCLNRMHEMTQNTKVIDMEIIMDEECINFIARFQPEAKPLRSVMMLARMVSDLERIGDKAVNIAESALSLYYKPLANPSIDIRRMTEETLKMMSDSILSLVHEDAKLACDVLKRDDIVDGLRDQILRELIASMVADPSTVESSLHLLRVARNLEKIADITTNICEEAVYIKEGRVVKHHHG